MTAVKKVATYVTFGRWLKKRREIEQLTQAEAAEKMRALDPKGKGVSESTWNRWERGHRLPFRANIDLVAQVIKASPKHVRRRAGYEAPERPVRRKRHDVMASMLKVLSSDMEAGAKVLHLYALGIAYPNAADPVKNRKLMMEIARAFDSLINVSKQAQTDAIERIRQICREAKGGVQFTVPPDRATMIIPRQGFPPVMLGTRIEIGYEDADGYEVSDEYMVSRIKRRKNRILARIVCVDHTDFNKQ
jgi:transcriptional regulator with XRE-family HTH domain